MKLIVGLGNPGRKYQSTRHNVGYEVLARLAQQHAAGTPVGKFEGELVDYASPSGRVVLLSPLTYMNRSGQSVRAAFDFYKMDLAEVIVVCDDLNLPLGKMRFRAHGSAGGQKGLADIIQRLGSDKIARLRIGIGAVPSDWDAADFVLGRFSAEERGEIDPALVRAAQGLDDWVAHGIDYCMNHYNSSLS